MIRWDGGGTGRWTSWSCRNSMGGGYRDGGGRWKGMIRASEIEGDDPVGRAVDRVVDRLKLQK